MAPSNPTSSARRIVITGTGLISPLGNSQEALWDALCSGRSGVRELVSLPTDHLPTRFGAEAWDFTGAIGDFGPLEGKQKKSIRKGLNVTCREIQMGVAAAQLALVDAGLKMGDYDPDRTGVVYGCDYIMTVPTEFTEGVRHCLGDDGFAFAEWAEKGLPRVTPLWLLKYLPNMPASHIAIYNDMRGPNNSITLREASANLALMEAYTTIQRGAADRILTGATGTRIHPLRTVHVVLQEEVAPGGEDPASLSRPFDRDRTGLVLGEGAGAVMVEALEAAEARGAQILGEIVGYGSSTVIDRRGIAQPAEALENVLRQALQTSGLKPEDVGHVHAHGLSTSRLDRAEATAIRRVFGEHPVPVAAAKSYMGNLGAGGGMVEVIASLAALAAGQQFPILNYETPDPDCPITAARAGAPLGDTFINLNVSPQGQASAIVVRR